MPKVSIIVPVYNTAEYLPKCINSLINQTFRDIQIILVDDGSQDNSLEICNNFAKKDSRITVLSQQNQGPSAARNKALEIAKGEFIGFLDSDDYTSEHTYETALTYMTKDVDLVIWGVNVLSTDNLPYVDWFQDIYFKIRATNKIKLDKNIKFQTAVVPWNKLYKKSIIDNNDITFPEGRLYEDNAFWWKYTMFCQNAYFLEDKLSYYNLRKTSLRGDVIHKIDEKEADRIYMVEDVYNFCKSRNILTPDNKELIESLFVDSFVNAYKESVNKNLMIYFAKNLIEKIDMKKSDDEFINKMIQEIQNKKVPNTPHIKIHSLSNKNQYIKEIKKSVQAAKNNISEASDLRLASENIQHAAALLENFSVQYLEKQLLSKELTFLKEYCQLLPACQQIDFNTQNISIVLEFLHNLYKNKRAEEVIKFASIMQIIFPKSADFYRIKADAYWFLKKDAVKAFHFYRLYSEIIKDNASVYKVMSDICKSQGDTFNELFYTKLALNSQ